MTEIIEKLYNLLKIMLEHNCPVLSGNMKAHIEVKSIEEHEIVLCISAPFYDLKEWKKTGKIVFTGPNVFGETDYAYAVNQRGAFGRHNKSQYWANRSVYETANTIANEIGAELINMLPLA